MSSSLVSHMPNISTYAFHRIYSTIENQLWVLFVFSDPESKFVGCVFLCICNRYKKSGTSSDRPSSRDDESSNGDELCNRKLGILSTLSEFRASLTCAWPCCHKGSIENGTTAL